MNIMNRIKKISFTHYYKSVSCHEKLYKFSIYDF